MGKGMFIEGNHTFQRHFIETKKKSLTQLTLLKFSINIFSIKNLTFKYRLTDLIKKTERNPTKKSH